MAEMQWLYDRQHYGARCVIIGKGNAHICYVCHCAAPRKLSFCCHLGGIGVKWMVQNTVMKWDVTEWDLIK